MTRKGEAARHLPQASGERAGGGEAAQPDRAVGGAAGADQEGVQVPGRGDGQPGRLRRPVRPRRPHARRRPARLRARDRGARGPHARGGRGRRRGQRARAGGRRARAPARRLGEGGAGRVRGVGEGLVQVWFLCLRGERVCLPSRVSNFGHEQAFCVIGNQWRAIQSHELCDL